MTKRHWKKMLLVTKHVSFFFSELQKRTSMPPCLFFSPFFSESKYVDLKNNINKLYISPPNKKREGLPVVKKLLHITQFRALSSCGNSLTPSSIFLNCSFTEAWRKKFGRKCESFLPGKKIFRPFQEFH